MCVTITNVMFRERSSAPCNLTTYQTRKPSHRKDDPAMRPTRECSDNFRESL